MNCIAIDGPAGAGKSTIAKRVSRELGFIYVDTGSMYRAMALYFLNQQMDLNDEEKIADACKQVSISLTYEEGSQHVYLNGADVTASLRKEEVGNAASKTATYGCVRSKLVELQQEIAAKTPVVMDGRDIGTCVLPQADCKIYLTASVETRAKRRFLELSDKGEQPDLEAIKRDIAARDEQDMNRKISPLKQAEDALLVDSSEMTIEEVCTRIIEIYRSKEH